MKSRVRLVPAALVALFVMALSGFAPFLQPVLAEDQPPLPITHQAWNAALGPLTQEADGTVGENVYKNPSSPICTGSTGSGNVNTDCETAAAPHNETSIAIDPTDPNHLIGSANDYQLRLSSGGHVNETTYSRAHVSFDSGQTWSEYPIKYNGYASTGDPAVAFDATGRAYLATLGFVWSQGNGLGTAPDVLVTTSVDGGKSWSKPDRVASGTGGWVSPSNYNDKEYLTAWGDGNAIVTWTIFHLGQKGSYINSPIYASVTHDGGGRWSKPVQISGSASFCVGASGNTACNQDQGSTPVVTTDGRIFVSFLSTRNNTDFSDQYLVVQVDPQTGQRVAGPFKVGDVVDGIYDYPVSIDGRQTYQDSEFRSWSMGNLAADPTNGDHLAVVWSDMRNSPNLNGNFDPYSVTTNSDIVVSQSTDGGQTWSDPQALAISNDQFMPWGSYDSNGLLHIGFFDRSYDSANHAYGYTLASETAPSSLSFSTTQVTTVLSDPTQNTRWFSGRTPNPDFPNPTTFLGDYSNIATGSNGVVSYWTDFRNQVTFAGRTGSGEDAYFGVAP